MNERDLRAVALGHRLARLLRALDPNPADAFLALPIHTVDGVPGGTFQWQLTVSEAGVEQLTQLLEAIEDRQWGSPQPIRHLRAVAGEAS
ncbi:hypothetical protein [Streptomyces sp. NRRL S-813]|uniref:hypothetical protein n=1 Tax=Streptomyces sp. NRRL S-813 TaxID=1463919 RepID=UPI0004BFD68B|nr:hypothetical protein [Streptomyces sp. NRRL S-813]